MSGGPQTLCRTCEGSGQVPVWLYTDPLGVVDFMTKQITQNVDLGAFVRELFEKNPHAEPGELEPPIVVYLAAQANEKEAGKR